MATLQIEDFAARTGHLTGGAGSGARSLMPRNIGVKGDKAG